jgi:hypothetical protein
MSLVIATAFRWGLSTIRPDGVPFTPYYPAIILATLFAGRRLGLVTAAFGAALGLSVRFGTDPSQAALITRLAVYLVASTLFIFGADHFRLIARRLQEKSAKLHEADEYRKRVVAELEHRLKRKLESVQAVLENLRQERELLLHAQEVAKVGSWQTDLVARFTQFARA